MRTYKYLPQAWLVPVTYAGNSSGQCLQLTLKFRVVGQNRWLEVCTYTQWQSQPTNRVCWTKGNFGWGYGDDLTDIEHTYVLDFMILVSLNQVQFSHQLFKIIM